MDEVGLRICSCGHKIMEFRDRHYHVSSYTGNFEHLNYKCNEKGCECYTPKPSENKPSKMESVGQKVPSANINVPSVQNVFKM